MPQTPERRKKFLQDRLDAGLCSICANKRDRLDRKRCKSCRDADAARARLNVRVKRRVAALKRLGLCIRCKAKAVPGQTRCGYCAELQADTQKGTRDRRIKEGLCPECGKKADELESGRKHCRRCLDRLVNRRALKSNPPEALPSFQQQPRRHHGREER